MVEGQHVYPSLCWYKTKHQKFGNNETAPFSLIQNQFSLSKIKGEWANNMKFMREAEKFSLFGGGGEPLINIWDRIYYADKQMSPRQNLKSTLLIKWKKYDALIRKYWMIIERYS